MTGAEASIVAAIFSFMSAVWSSFAAERARNIGAKRNLVESDFKEISRLLWSVVAYSVKASNAGNDLKFDEFVDLANNSAKKLEELRIQHRIILYPVFDAIGALEQTPIFVKNLRNERIAIKDENAQNTRNEQIIDTANKLRFLIDRGFYSIYFKGKPPDTITRVQLSRSSKKLRKAFERFG